TLVLIEAQGPQGHAKLLGHVPDAEVSVGKFRGIGHAFAGRRHVHHFTFPRACVPASGSGTPIGKPLGRKASGQEWYFIARRAALGPSVKRAYGLTLPMLQVRNPDAGERPRASAQQKAVILVNGLFTTCGERCACRCPV